MKNFNDFLISLHQILIEHSRDKLLRLLSKVGTATKKIVEFSGSSSGAFGLQDCAKWINTT